MSKDSLRISFEFFPPKTEKGVENLRAAREELAKVGPEFFSVTYGAGGSTRDRTLDTVIESQKNSGVPTAPHLSCVGDSKESLSQLLNTYKENNISRIVALRGDLPSGMGASLGELAYASDLVAFIKEQHGDRFHLEVASYPEVHPQATSAKDDFQNFLTKVNAGADSSITQYFYNADAYAHFMEKCEKAGVTIPVYPGIMPITNYSNLARFSDNCGAEIPRWIRKELEGYGDDLDSIKAFGEEVVTKLCEQLLEQGAPGIHFYTLNQATPSLKVYNNLNL